MACDHNECAGESHCFRDPDMFPFFVSHGCRCCRHYGPCQDEPDDDECGEDRCTQCGERCEGCDDLALLCDNGLCDDCCGPDCRHAADDEDDEDDDEEEENDAVSDSEPR